MTTTAFVARSRVRRVARSEVQAFTDAVLAPAIADAISALVREAELRLEQKITRLQALIDQHRYAGAWQEGRSYKAGCIVSCGGSVHYCNADTTTKPGTSEAWVLMIPRPRDGKDAPAPPKPPEPTSPRRATLGQGRGP